MEKPLISVIIPVYNAERYIEESCQSVFSQTYPNWEIVVVDDGSTDNTWSILKNLAASRIGLTVIHTENRGVSAARNTGLDVARGEYITFLDADDKLTECALSVLYDRIEETNCEIAIGDTGKAEIWEGTKPLVYALESHLACHSACRKLYRTELLRDIRFVEGRRINEDGFFVFQCFLRQPKVATVTDHVYCVRQTAGSASRSKFSEKYLDILYFAEEKKQIIERQYPELSYLTEDLMVKANITLLRVLCRTYDSRWHSYEKSCIAVIKAYKKRFKPKFKSDERFVRIVSYGFFPVYKLRVYLARLVKQLWRDLKKNCD